MSKLAPLVYAVVLNWNRPEDTHICLASLARSDYSTFKMLVVDNGSDPKHAHNLRAEDFGAEVMWLDRNYGFAEGNNRGMKYAFSHGADYVFLLNNDTIVDPTMLSELVRLAEADPSVGIAGPIIYYTDAPDRVWFAGMRFRDGLYVVRRGLHLNPPLKAAEDVDFISGCGMLIRRSVLKEIGFFSSDYFMYYEDLDYCVRAQRGGFKLICATNARMWHAVSSSTGGPDSPLKQYYQVKSSLIFYRRHTKGLMYLLNVLLRFGHAFWVMLKMIFLGRLKWKAAQYYFRGIREAAGENFTHEARD